MTTAAQFLPHSRSLLILMLAALFGAFAVETGAAQSDSPPVATADVANEDQAEGEDALALSTDLLSAPVGTALYSPDPLRRTAGDASVWVPSDLRARMTSLREAFLHGAGMAETNDPYVLRRALNVRQFLSDELAETSARQAFIGLGNDGSLAVGARAKSKSERFPQVELPRDSFDSSRDGFLLMSIGI